MKDVVVNNTNRNLPLSVPGSVSTVVVTITVGITVITSVVPFVHFLVVGAGRFLFISKRTTSTQVPVMAIISIRRT